MFDGLKKKLGEYYDELMNMPGKIDDVAYGFAIGFMVGMVPWYGLQTAITVAFTRLFKKSMAAGVLGSIVSNPFTALPLFFVQYRIGRIILGTPKMKLPDNFAFDLELLHTLYVMGEDALYPILVGSVIVGIIGSVLSFFLVRRSLIAYRKRIYGRRKARRERKAREKDESGQNKTTA